MPYAAVAPISGAPRTCMLAMACAASATDRSCTVVKRCGSWVWSMIPTDQPSGSSQMVRVALPATFMAHDITAITANAKCRSAGRAALSRGAERDDTQGRRGAPHADRLRGRVQQPRPGARASGNLRPLGARRRGLPCAGDAGAARRARPDVRREPAPVHRPVMTKPEGKAPLALFIHGGYWRSLEPSLFSHMA